MQKVKLAKKWNDHKSGSTVEVDDLRATWLRDGGYEERGEPKAAGRRKAKFEDED